MGNLIDNQCYVSHITQGGCYAILLRLLSRTRSSEPNPPTVTPAGFAVLSGSSELQRARARSYFLGRYFCQVVANHISHENKASTANGPLTWMPVLSGSSEPVKKSDVFSQIPQFYSLSLNIAQCKLRIVNLFSFDLVTAGFIFCGPYVSASV